jgi:hypothetical protein
MLELGLKVLTAISIAIAGMYGGQKSKWVRRYLIPTIASIYTALKKKKKKWKATLFLPLIAILSMGYGEGSTIRTFIKKFVDEPWADRLTRISIGLLLSIPFVLFFGKWYASIVLPIAFSVRAGGIKLTEDYDFLIEDAIRYGSLGILVVI